MLNRARMLCFTLLVVAVTLMSGIKWSIRSMYLYRGYQMIYQIGVFISRVSSDLSDQCIYIAGIKLSIRSVYLYRRYQVIYQIGVFISQVSSDLSDRCIYIAVVRQSCTNSSSICLSSLSGLSDVCLRWFHCWIYLPNLKLISSKAAVILLIWLANLRHWRLPVLMVEQ